MAAPHEILAALGDETRMEIVWKLSTKGPMPMNQLMRYLPMSRQGATKHIRSLQEAGVLKTTKSGRTQVVELEPDALKEAGAWLSNMSTEWDQKASLRATLGTSGKRTPKAP